MAAHVCAGWAVGGGVNTNTRLTYSGSVSLGVELSTHGFGLTPPFFKSRHTLWRVSARTKFITPHNPTEFVTSFGGARTLGETPNVTVPREISSADVRTFHASLPGRCV